MKGSLKTLTASVAGAIAVVAATLAAPHSAHAQKETIKVAMGDIASIESLNLLIAMQRAEERGVPMELTFFNSEDVATQAVAGGQAHIGVGAPYAFIQNSGAPLRMFYRISTLLFFPVVNAEVYDGWQDLDGEKVTVHSRGSGTEALMRLMEQKHGIEYSQVSYVPGSEVRAGAMLKGTINATIVDSANFRLLKERGGDKFQRLPVEGVNATDEALYAHKGFLEERQDDVTVFVEELLRTWQDINQDPSIVADLREQYDLLPDLPDDAAERITSYYTNAVDDGLYPTDGGDPADVRDDMAFLAAAGQVEKPEGGLDVSQYWTFEPLKRARSAIN